ncbi:hypothetical protein EMCG_06173 [[Emmonsia] crescens]|uniref:Uncharacterized protein n=1 Tax=[Emmonsia] crescens TaxID=73230 RepID=A0A0G2JBV7_9EURO|nr:hypothetical protein EMCG_06173 [Emmonsia crescens UAMH 3008]
MITCALEENIITLDIISTLKKILIEESEKQYETALRIVRMRELKLETETAIVKKDCTVCLTQTEDSIFTNLHKSRTCMKYNDKILKEYEVLRKLKKKLDIKNCLKCMTLLKKTESCNHIMCDDCKAHLC